MRPLPLLVAVSVVAVADRAIAQDPVPLYPKNYTVLVENDRVRVMDFRLRKGDSERFHHHPPHVLYVLEPFKITFKFPDGRTGVREAKAGEVLFSDAVTHSPTNDGGSDAHGILVELKEPATMGSVQRPGAVNNRDLVTALTFIKGIPGREAELTSELLALTAPTRAESGALAYDLYQSVRQPNEFVRFEMWRDSAALEAHKRTPHLKASFARRQQQGWTTDITLWRRIEP